MHQVPEPLHSVIYRATRCTQSSDRYPYAVPLVLLVEEKIGWEENQTSMLVNQISGKSQAIVSSFIICTTH